MSMTTLHIRPSAIIQHDDCPWSYQAKYELGIRSWAESINLSFGTSVHKGCTEYLKGTALGQSVDPVRVFEQSFQQAMDTRILQFPTTKSPEDFWAIGQRLTESFPEAWDKTGLTVLVDPQGEPVVERRLKARLAPGIELAGTPDVVAFDQEGHVGIPDIKTPASPSEPFFAEVSEQLTSYQFLVDDEHNRAMLGLDRVHWVAFLEGVKRKVPKTGKGQGPTWESLVPSKAHSAEQINDLKMKAVEIKRNRERGMFPKRPRMAYNTPCSMCELRGLCHKGDKQGLIMPDQKRTHEDRTSQSIPAAAAF